MSLFASSSRVPIASSSSSPLGNFVRGVSGAHRYVKGPPPRPRMPKTRSPYLAHPDPRHPTNRPADSRAPELDTGATPKHPLGATPIPRSSTYTELQNSSLKLHHSPPDSAPSYTIGNTPDLLKWLGGTSLQLSGEENAPYLREKKTSWGRADDKPYEPAAETVSEIVALREKGLSRNNVIKRYVFCNFCPFEW